MKLFGKKVGYSKMKIPNPVCIEISKGTKIDCLYYVESTC